MKLDGHHDKRLQGDRLYAGFKLLVLRSVKALLTINGQKK